MVLRMARPWRHSHSGFYWFRKVIPSDLRPIIGRREEKFSLKTKDPGEAQTEHAIKAAEIAEKWQRLRGNGALDHVDFHALAGECFRETVASKYRDPGDAQKYAAQLKNNFFAHTPPVRFGGNVLIYRRATYGAEARAFPLHRGYRLDDDQLDKFLSPPSPTGFRQTGLPSSRPLRQKLSSLSVSKERLGSSLPPWCIFKSCISFSKEDLGDELDEDRIIKSATLRRMESSVASFALTIQRQLADVEVLLSRIDAHDESVEETASLGNDLSVGSQPDAGHRKTSEETKIHPMLGKALENKMPHRKTATCELIFQNWSNGRAGTPLAIHCSAKGGLSLWIWTKSCSKRTPFRGKSFRRLPVGLRP